MDMKTGLLSIGVFAAALSPAGVALAGGELWFGKGPRVVSDSCEALASATVFRKSESGPTLLDAIPVDKEGRLVLNRFVECSMRFDVICRGHYTRLAEFELPGRDGFADIVLRRKVRPHPMRCFDAEKVFPSNVCGDVCKVDLVEGDFMPPYGYGRVADAVVRVGIVTNDSGGAQHKAVLELLDERSGLGPPVKLEDDTLETPREVDDAACTNRVAEFPSSFLRKGVSFRVRGHYGFLTRLSLSRTHSYMDSGARRFKAQAGQKLVDSAPVDQVYQVCIKGRVNTEAGERGLEHVPARARPPERSHAPGSDGVFAFGVSGNGRSAVWLGPASKDWSVPGIFPRAVYTSSPAEDLHEVETLYIPSPDRVPRRAFAGMPRLRTVCCRYSGLWIESEAFAECPALNAIILWGGGTIAGDAFSGCAPDMTGIFFKTYSSGPVAWQDLDCANVWKRQVDVALWGRESDLFGMKVDIDRGKVEMPVIRFSGDSIVQEFEDGRIYEMSSDGSEERRWSK